MKQNRNIFGFSHTFDSEVAIVQNKFQQTNKTKINHVNDNYIKFEVSLHLGGSGLLCGMYLNTQVSNGLTFVRT